MDRKPFKPKKCQECGDIFTPFRMGQKVCGPSCASQYAQKSREKDERREHKKAKEKVKRRSEWLTEAQTAYNRFIRARDYGLPCISCGREEHEIEEKFMAGKWDCGHFKTVGGFPELRYIPLNAAKQCKSCNSGSYYHAKKKATVSSEYRERLIERIGLENVEWLEGPHEPKKYTVEELKEIKQGFNQWARELERENE